MDSTLRRCQRQFGLRYVLSRGGFRSDAPAETREAYRLKQLKHLDAEVGSSVHRRAQECVRAIQAGQDLPTLEMVIDTTRRELNDLVISSRDIAAFKARPNRVDMLAEIYYAADGQLQPEKVERARRTMLTALNALLALPIWAELREVENPAANIILPEDFYRFEHRGCHVYAAPDLVFRHQGRWVVVDWKTGGQANDGEVDQIAVYALAVVYGFGWALSEGCEGRVVNLVRGEEDRIRLTADDIADAERRVLSGTEQLRAMQFDATGKRRALAREDFAMSQQQRHCTHCGFRAACYSGIARAIADRDNPAEATDDTHRAA